MITRKTRHKSDKDVIKDLANSGYRTACDEEVRNKLPELNKRHKKLYQDLAKT